MEKLYLYIAFKYIRVADFGSACHNLYILYPLVDIVTKVVTILYFCGIYIIKDPYIRKYLYLNSVLARYFSVRGARRGQQKHTFFRLKYINW